MLGSLQASPNKRLCRMAVISDTSPAVRASDPWRRCMLAGRPGMAYSESWNWTLPARFWRAAVGVKA
jgi:hypothetical protein